VLGGGGGEALGGEDRRRTAIEPSPTAARLIAPLRALPTPKTPGCS